MNKQTKINLIKKVVIKKTKESIQLTAEESKLFINRLILMEQQGHGTHYDEA